MHDPRLNTSQIEMVAEGLIGGQVAGQAKLAAAAPAEIQKLSAEIKRLQQELTVKEQAN